MNEVPSPQLRISDLDREAALQALGEHMSVGRIDLDEYGDRSAKVTAAKTRGELAGVFADLPQPHPQFGGVPTSVEATSSTEVQPPPAPGLPATWASRPLQQRLTAAAVPVVWLAGLALMLTVGGWWWFLIPLMLTGVGRQLWGREWGPGHDRHEEAYERRQDIRDQQEDRRDAMRDRRDVLRGRRDDRRGRRRY